MALRDSPMDEGGALRALEARVAALESANPLQRGTVDSGGKTRIAPGGVLAVDGRLESGADGVLDWDGFVDFARRVFTQAGFTSNGDSYVNGLFRTSGNAYFAGDESSSPEFVVGVSDMVAGDMPVWLHGIAEHTSASGLRALAVNEHNEVFSVPFPTSSGGGGNPGGGGDNPKGLVYPYPLAQAGDRYGPRDYAPSPYHYGIDWPKPHGTPIPACGDGTVILSENTGDLWGEFIRIDHGDGIWTGYAHMHTGGRYVSVGDTVTRGQIIGGVGTTGPSTGNHLHWEVYVDGSRVDPEWYVGPE